MARNTTFGKKQIIELIEILKKEEVSSTSFYELAQNMDKYFPNHYKSKKQLIIAMRSFAKLFEDANINIYVYRENKYIKGKELIEKVLLYIKNELQKDIITGQELKQILLEKYDFKLYLNSTFLINYNVIEVMDRLSLSFKTNTKRKMNALAILEEFSKSNIVKELNSKNEKINISSLNKLLENKISLASLHNHANYIISMNIPIIKNKVVKNSTYDEKDIINKIASTLKSMQKTDELGHQ